MISSALDTATAAIHLVRQPSRDLVNEDQIIPHVKMIISKYPGVNFQLLKMRDCGVARKRPTAIKISRPVPYYPVGEFTRE